MEIKSVLIKDTKKEERIRIVQEGLNQCGGACDFCNGCGNLGGGSKMSSNTRFALNTWYAVALVNDGNTLTLYINGEKELRQINEEYRANSGKVI